MRTVTLGTAGRLAAALLLAGLLLAQPPLAGTAAPQDKPPPPKEAPGGDAALAALLDKALKDNPDIRVAEAQVRAAEAVLNRTRLQVRRQVVALVRALEEARRGVRAAEADARRGNDLVKLGSRSQTEQREAEARVGLAKAQLAQVEEEVSYVLGGAPPPGR
jgi:outer membrane protein TolC